jgi:hypothetical protein
MPKPMEYDTQAIVYIADDLRENAESLQNKRALAGDGEVTYTGIGTVQKSRIFSAGDLGVLPRVYRQPGSRLIILGHGDADSTIIATATEGGETYTPEEFVGVVEGWLGNTDTIRTSGIKRISLHMCYGGGNRGNTTGPVSSAMLALYRVDPRSSFAYAFASRAGHLAADVTARTGTVHMHIHSVRPEIGAEYPVHIRRHVGGGHHQREGDKFIFRTSEGSDGNTPIPPNVVDDFHNVLL